MAPVRPCVVSRDNEIPRTFDNRTNALDELLRREGLYEIGRDPGINRGLNVISLGVPGEHNNRRIAKGRFFCAANKVDDVDPVEIVHPPVGNNEIEVILGDKGLSLTPAIRNGDIGEPQTREDAVNKILNHVFIVDNQHLEITKLISMHPRNIHAGKSRKPRYNRPQYG